MCMKKYILLILMSGILFGNKELDISIEKTLKNAGFYYAEATVTKHDQTKQLNETKKEEAKVKKVPTAKSSAVAATKKTAPAENNAKSAETVKKKETKANNVKKADTKTNVVKTAPVKNESIKQENVAPAKKVEKIVSLEKNSYCNSPVGRHQFYEMNEKGEYRADIKFKYCMINGEKKENIIVGIIATDLNAVNEYIKKHSYLHFKDKEKLRKNADGNNYYYDSAWTWDNSSEYPAAAWQEKK